MFAFRGFHILKHLFDKIANISEQCRLIISPSFQVRTYHPASLSNGILVSDQTLRAARSRLEMAEIGIGDDFGNEFTDMKVYRLLERRMEKTKAALAN
jgi:hypothetical protein